jgi:hypothetical protein
MKPMRSSPPISAPDGAARKLRFTDQRSSLSTLYRQLHGELEGRLWAGRRGDFGNCVALEARAAATAAAIEAEMAEHGYSAADAQALVANARRAVSARFRQWEDAYVLNEAGKLAAREAHPSWFGRERPVEPYANLQEALACWRWAVEAGQDRFAAQQRLKAQCWADELQREMEYEGHRPEEIAERMWRAWSIPFLETWRRQPLESPHSGESGKGVGERP